MTELMPLVRAYREAEELAAKVGIACEIAVILRPRLFGYLSRRLPRAGLEDVLQEVLKAIALGLSEFRGDLESVFKGWYYAIARNKATDWLRKNERRGEVELMGDDEFWEAIEASAKYEPISSEERRELAEVLELLKCDDPCGHRYLTDYFIDGLTFPEIAEAEGKTTNAIRMKVTRCLMKLRESLAED